jgi:outer membrane receptor protein involved in Fe transport
MNGKMVLCLFVYTLFIQPVFSQTDTLKQDAVKLEEVVIQSFKYEENFSTLPIAASTVGSKAIQNQQVRGIKDISSFIPNLFMPDYGSRLTSPIFIRGIGSKINSPSVGLYVDGIPYFEKSAFDFDLNEADYIEILRGPQGTLYGRNTMGGLINVYTKSPLVYKETLVGASYGNYGYMNEQFAHYGNCSDNTFGYAVSANATHSDGYFTNLFTEKEADDLNSGNGKIRLDWRLRPNLTLRLVGSLDFLKQGGYPYAKIDPETGVTGDVNYNDYSSYDRIISSNGFSLIYTTDKFSLNTQTAYQYLSDDQQIDQDFSKESVYFAIQKQKQSSFSQEVTVKSINNQNRYKWLFGAFAFRQNVDNEIILEYKQQKYSTDKLYDIPTTGFSVYHQSVLDNLLTDGLSFTFGIRYDYEKASNDYVAYRDTTDRHDRTDAFFSKMNFNQLTPKVALQYTLPSKQMFYASASKGYKTGGFNTSFEKEEDRSFNPEYSWNYEIGSKLHFLQNMIQAEICLFYIDWKNQQIYQPLPSGKGQMLKNAGRSESKGAEISIQAQPTNRLHLQANWGYTKALFKEYQRSVTINYGGKFLPLVPKQTFALGLDYSFPVSKQLFDRLALNVNYIGIDRLYWNEDNAVSQPYSGQLNGKLAMTKGLATFSLWAKNITDTNYSVFYFESMGSRFAQKGKPFTFGTTISIKIQ